MSTDRIRQLEQDDVVVIGAGHAGCEAALACARLGKKTVIFTVSVDSIALMPCNPNIGGTSKGHLVREIDAMGGEMAKNIDRTFIQSRMLNRSKGPAVHSLRAQADKQDYSRAMRRVLENQDNLTICQAEVSELILAEDLPSVTGENISTVAGENLPSVSEENTPSVAGENLPPKETGAAKRIAGVRTRSGAVYLAKAVILCTGVYLRARCIYGDVSTNSGPNGLLPANYLTASLEKCGISLRRFKTGTPARIDGRTIDFSKMKVQPGDVPVEPFSFSTDPKDVQIEQLPCYLTGTTEETHAIIRANLDRSPLYGGVIEGTGPRYCPSIEDKVVRFPEKDHHQVFIEPEGRYTNEMYIDGMSSSMPEDVQVRMYRSVPGLENAHIVRPAYAIEYDCIDPKQLGHSLEFKSIEGLFAAGQFNGSSGYEEAAAQGLIAGINAVRKIDGKPAITVDRSEGYVGVLIDDLVTKENFEPYRMMTARAEYRLLLRQDNADLRLRKKGYEAGLISEEEYTALLRKEEAIRREIDRVNSTAVSMNQENKELLSSLGTIPPEGSVTLGDLIRRPELSYDAIAGTDPQRPALPKAVREQVNIEIKYEGYIRRQKKQVEQFRKMETRKIPADIDYDDVGSLRLEAIQKLKSFHPENIGQASRISGVSPADISVLLVYLEKKSRMENAAGKE